LQHSTGLRKLLPQLAQDPQCRFGGGVILHVERHRRTSGTGGGGDCAGMVEGDLLAVRGQRLSYR
jgi:hypothetical protein